MATIEISGSVVGYDGETARPGKQLYVYESSHSPTFFDKRIQMYTLTAGGWVPPLIFERGATIYLYMDSPGFDEDKYMGRAVTLPDSATADLGDLSS